MFLLIISFMLGLSLLLPWNSFLKSLPYIMTRVPEEWRGIAPLWLTLTFTLTNCLVLLGLTLSDVDSKIMRKIRGGGSVERIVGGRLYGGLMGCAGLLLISCVVPLIDLIGYNTNGNGNGKNDYDSSAHLIFFMGIFMCTGWTMCLLQRSVYPLMSLLPGKSETLIPSMLSGQAMSGIAASLGSFLISGKNGGSGAGMALIYYGCSIIALIVTAVLFNYYEREYESKYFKNVDRKDKQEFRTFSIKDLKEAAKAVGPWPQLLTLNFAVTLCLFPGLLTSSSRSLQSNEFYIPLTFLVFDVFDLLGKVMPSMIRIGLGPRSLLAMGFPIIRILFIPLFLSLPNFSQTPKIRSDWPYFLTLALMALTSGWGNSICLINAPQKLNEPTEEMNDGVGSLMGLSITFGLLIGSGGSLLIKTIIKEIL